MSIIKIKRINGTPDLGSGALFLQRDYKSTLRVSIAL